jgi:CRP-like cAMP-binding protein
MKRAALMRVEIGSSIGSPAKPKLPPTAPDVAASAFAPSATPPEVGLLTNFSSLDLAAIESHLQRASYQHGDVIFREGDPGGEVFILTKGTASAFLQSPDGTIRLATFAPGTVFGELAILDGGQRSATVVADEDLVCFVLTMSNFTALTERNPSVAVRILAAIGRELSARLRTANRTIHQLET